MNKMNYIIATLFVILLSCSEEKTPEFVTPSNLVVTSDISNDGSGKVTFGATASNASSFTFAFGDGTAQESITGMVVKIYEMGGQNTYSVTVTAPSILIILMGSLGDVARGLCLVSHIKNHRPESKVSWLIESRRTDMVSPPSPVTLMIHIKICMPRHAPIIFF